MQLLMLVEKRMAPVPETLQVLQSYGEETIMHEDGRTSGSVMLIEGQAEAFVEWLKTFDGVWQSSSPMTGDWRVFHIKKELA